ncbi:psbP domain-containing protein 7, chloroplastic [Salvia hispanica]|uniref:psbP domain-containing protein 7, chloroplastic n=1 Tax=Salvia hispanica TaxID=49212 RepID=UPI00200971B4|nr:psbP domain-containing protein 7, chloroplastic [Salvia hispanica]
MKMIGAQHTFQSRCRICMTQSSDDNTPTPADQFAPLQSVFRRRLLTGVGAASLLAVGANFGGVTSFLLGFTPEAARSLKLDALYPVRGYSRYIDTDEGFEFVYPERWLGDQRLLYRAAEKAERSLDPPSLSGGGGPRRNVTEPVVAFGPPGSTGELNVSVFASRIPNDFSIDAFGGARDVGEAFIRTITRSGQVQARLIGTRLREDSERKNKYYELEFQVESPTFRRHNVAVCCAQNGKLFTLNAQSPESAWPQFESQLRAIAASFSFYS